MTTHGSTRRRLLVMMAATGVAVGIAVNAFATGAELPATATVCIKPNGQLRAVTPANPVCVEPETTSEWTVNGVKAITAGAGLVSRDDGGLVQLEVDPGLIENANSGKIVAGYDDGPGFANGLRRRLPLPPGAYAITAKLTLTARPETPHPPEVKYSHVVSCRLEAGADFDESRVVVSGTQQEDATKTLAMPLEVVHRFAESGEAELTCATWLTFECAPLACIDDLGAKYEDLKIVAIRGSSLSNTFIGP